MTEILIILAAYLYIAGTSMMKAVTSELDEKWDWSGYLWPIIPLCAPYWLFKAHFNRK